MDCNHWFDPKNPAAIALQAKTNAAGLHFNYEVFLAYGGQYSFGHALFFGIGAYIQALFQIKFGMSPWFAVGFALSGATLVGAFVGYLSFRYGLRVHILR